MKLTLWELISGYVRVWFSGYFGVSSHSFRYDDNRWDTLLSELLDEENLQVYSEDGYRYTVKINGVEIWISNKYYYYGSGSNQKVPSIKTMLRLEKLINMKLKEGTK